jgi:hypothetical protein
MRFGMWWAAAIPVVVVSAKTGVSITQHALPTTADRLPVTEKRRLGEEPHSAALRGIQGRGSI